MLQCRKHVHHNSYTHMNVECYNFVQACHKITVYTKFNIINVDIMDNTVNSPDQQTHDIQYKNVKLQKVE